MNDADADIMTPEEQDKMRAELIAMQAAELAKPKPSAESIRGSRAKKAAKVVAKQPRTARDIARQGQPVNANSIRQTIMRLLLEGRKTEEIAAEVKERFPQSMAASKSSIHIGYYRSKLRKAGLLPPASTE